MEPKTEQQHSSSSDLHDCYMAESAQVEDEDDRDDECSVISVSESTDMDRNLVDVMI
jgi:hypothetical protein